MTIGGKTDFDLIRMGLSEAPPHDHDYLAYDALDRLERQFTQRGHALEAFRAYCKCNYAHSMADHALGGES